MKSSKPVRKWVKVFCLLTIVVFFCLQEFVFAHSEKFDAKWLPVKFQAPDFDGLTNWLNTPGYKSMKELEGSVVLIDFWTYSCYNCINTFPYVQGWHKKYANKGLTVIGVHAPEFGFEKKLENLKKAVKKRGLTFPIVQDNGFKLWRRYGNRYWPAFYLIDKRGKVRYSHFGEGRYKQTESAIVALLNEPA
jgi:thiol-disulfide isomerase/thioredoxin